MYFLTRKICVSAIKTLTVFTIVGLFSISQADIAPAEKLKIVAAAKSKVQGKIITIKPKEKKGHPNCHTVKMLSDKQEFIMLPIQCGED